MEELNETLGGLIIVVGAIIIVYIIARYRFLLRKMMIEKGVPLNTISNKNKLIDATCILFFIGLGILVSAFYNTLGLLEDTKESLTWGTILIFGSFGTLLAHLIRKRSGE